jgi:hypothetical protein
LLKGETRVDDCAQAARAWVHDDNRAFAVSEGRCCRLLKSVGDIGFGSVAGAGEAN